MKSIWALKQPTTALFFRNQDPLRLEMLSNYYEGSSFLLFSRRPPSAQWAWTAANGAANWGLLPSL